MMDINVNTSESDTMIAEVDETDNLEEMAQFDFKSWAQRKGLKGQREKDTERREMRIRKTKTL